MEVKYLNSEAVEIDGRKMVYLGSPHAMIERIFEALASIGPEKFFSNPDEKTKKLREGMAEAFFALALKKDSGQDWWMTQPDEDPPDFVLTSWTENPITVTVAPFELVEIPPRCASFEEMMSIIRGKLDKGYPSNYHLLVFVNHESSIDWIELLHRGLETDIAFQTLWTLHLLQNKETHAISVAVANKLRPFPLSHSEISFESGDGLRLGPLPGFMEVVENGDRAFIKFNEEFAMKLRKEMMKSLRDRRMAR
jgi:hypothetical protein